MAYDDNSRFASLHKVEYIIWEGAHHMHQTDAGFINGNFLGIVKNSALSDQKMTLNLDAIDRFLKG